MKRSCSTRRPPHTIFLTAAERLSKRNSLKAPPRNSSAREIASNRAAWFSDG